MRNLFLLMIIFFGLESHSLSCLLQPMDLKRFSELDLIVKGEVIEIQRDSKRRDGDVPYKVKVSQAWKGARAGSVVEIVYRVLGGDGFPYQLGRQELFFASRDKMGVFRQNGCTSSLDFPLTEDQKEYLNNPPAYGQVTEKQKKIMQELEVHRELYLDEMAKKYKAPVK